MEKKIFAAGYEEDLNETYEDVKDQLEAWGWEKTVEGTISKFRWQNSTSTAAYLEANDTTRKINFKTSGPYDPENGGNVNLTYAFSLPLADFESFSDHYDCGMICLDLADGGTVLYMTTLPHGTDPKDLEFSCITEQGNICHNGLIICTPQEDDEYTRYVWRYDELLRTLTGDYKDTKPWVVDKGQGTVKTGIEIPNKLFHPIELGMILIKCYLDRNGWSDYIFNMVAGQCHKPSMIFTIDNQKYITFTDNANNATDKFRIPAFKLPKENYEINDPTSTEEYSDLKSYLIGAYCIYEGKLYRCTSTIEYPEAFNPEHWVVTTVAQEK